MTWGGRENQVRKQSVVRNIKYWEGKSLYRDQQEGPTDFITKQQPVAVSNRSSDEWRDEGGRPVSSKHSD